LIQFWNFGIPLISRERYKLKTSNLGRRRKAVSSNQKKIKIGSKRFIWRSRDPILEFWDPIISRERLKLETSNLALRRMAVSSNEKNSKLNQKGSCGGHVTQFWSFGTPLISRERLKLDSSNLGRRRKAVSSNKKNIKIGSKRFMWVSRDPILEFWDPPNISRTVKARKFKFGTETDGGVF